MPTTREIILSAHPEFSHLNLEDLDCFLEYIGGGKFLDFITLAARKGHLEGFIKNVRNTENFLDFAYDYLDCAVDEYLEKQGESEEAILALTNTAQWFAEREEEPDDDDYSEDNYDEGESLDDSGNEDEFGDDYYDGSGSGCLLGNMQSHF